MSEEKNWYWYPCPDCGKSLKKIRKDTLLINSIEYCKRCKKEIVVTIVPECRVTRE